MHADPKSLSSESDANGVACGDLVLRDRPWWGYPVGTKAPAIGGGHWIKVRGGWQWHTGDIFSTPGADSANYVILPQNKA